MLYRDLLKDPEGTRPLLRLGDRWDVKIDLKDTGTEDVGWIVLPQHRNKYQILRFGNGIGVT